MDRLTFEGNFCDIAMCRENPCPYNGSCSQRETWERLKEWEDTGLTPEEVKNWQDIYNEILTRTYGPFHQKIADWLKAEQEGRLVVLPVKVGDVIYKPVHGTDGDGVWAIEVCYINRTWYEDGTENDSIVGSILPDGGGDVARAADLGKTVFLTQEEAEAALKGGADHVE